MMDMITKIRTTSPGRDDWCMKDGLLEFLIALVALALMVRIGPGPAVSSRGVVSLPRFRGHCGLG